MSDTLKHPCKRHKTRRNIITFLLSVCLFLAVICACLLVALILIGKNLANIQNCYNSDDTQNNLIATNDKSINNEVNNEIDNSDEGFSVDNDGSAISVKINVNNKKTENWSSAWRLPRDVVPQHYDLTLIPLLDANVFRGTNNITLQFQDSRNHLIVHSYKLNITKVALFNEGGSEIEILDHHPDPVHQLHVVDLEDSLKSGTYYLYFEFEGSLKNIIGLYRSAYVDIDGETRYIATSKLEPTYARQAFPCFDEPNYKAKFTVQLVKPKNDTYIALSNMDQIGEPEPLDNSASLVRFNTSVPMSTYVSCFIVCDFIHIDAVAKASVGNDVNLRLFATRAQIDKTKFALEVAQKVTSYYISYFGIEYPLPKLDMIAIPDFVSGAMEHWGLVTYRETALLYDEAASSVQNRERVAIVVAHETAHMWFGNLVTLNWWNDLWLNEGFASILQYKATHQAYPDWGLMDKFVVSQVHPVLQTDASLASHPIVVTVETPDQITEIFDAISYNKGASVLRMLEAAVGEEKFRQAISNYLNNHKYGNAVTKNLWDEIQKIENGFDVAEVMDTWTVQMGFPMVTVEKNGDSYVLTQKRFLSDPDLESQQKPSPLDYKWTIPITYATDNGPAEKLHWFDKSASQLTLDIPKSKWVKFNVDNIGYYRVNYSKEMWDELSENINSMSVSNKANLLDDSFNIAKAGLLAYSIPLEMTKFLKDENNYVVWIVASSKLNELSRLISSETEIHEKLQHYIRSLVSPIQEKLTWDENPSDTHIQKYTRTVVCRLACEANDHKALEQAADLFNKWLSGGKLPQNTKDSVYVFGMTNATAETWNKLFVKYTTETDAQEKIKLMDGLAAVRNCKLIKKLLDLAKNESIVRGQDYFNVLTTISENPVGTSIVWDYVREHWKEIVDRFTLNDRYLGRMVLGITSSFSTTVRLHEMQDFFKRYPEAGAGATARKQALEKVANNIKWVEKYNAQVKAWLDTKV